MAIAAVALVLACPISSNPEAQIISQSIPFKKSPLILSILHNMAFLLADGMEFSGTFFAIQIWTYQGNFLRIIGTSFPDLPRASHYLCHHGKK
jgi:hypothetical protein